MESEVLMAGTLSSGEEQRDPSRDPLRDPHRDPSSEFIRLKLLHLLFAPSLWVLEIILGFLCCACCIAATVDRLTAGRSFLWTTAPTADAKQTAFCLSAFS